MMNHFNDNKRITQLSVLIYVIFQKLCLFSQIKYQYKPIENV